MNRPIVCFILLGLGIAPLLAERKTENIIFVMTDGFRLQELFSGAEASLITKETAGSSGVDVLRQAFWRDTAVARREALMPFLWGTVSRSGQIYGNREFHSDAAVKNGKNFSYPGYSEALCGFPDPRITSNDKILNSNITVLEWLHQKPGFRNKVAAFGAWDVFPYIFNAPRAGFPVNAGYEPLTAGPLTPAFELLNQLKAEAPRVWPDEAFDSLPFHTALEYLKDRKPRVLYLSLGETDEWAHAGNYGEYLQSAHRVDAYLKSLWETAQSMPEYRGKTTLIFSTDHGRGDAPTAWKSHGEKIADSKYIWMAFLGPDTRPLGERSEIPAVTQSQIAATLAALLGEDYAGSVDRAGKPIADVLP
ncbi:MAG: AP protein [Bryobacteraceae bacterium]